MIIVMKNKDSKTNKTTVLMINQALLCKNGQETSQVHFM